MAICCNGPADRQRSEIVGIRTSTGQYRTEDRRILLLPLTQRMAPQTTLCFCIYSTRSIFSQKARRIYILPSAVFVQARAEAAIVGRAQIASVY